MARLRLVISCLILAGILIVQATADESEKKSPSVADQPVASSHEWEEAEAPEIRRLGKHHSSDKSVAGGGVIIGGLVTAIFAAVFCYIRVTRKKGSDDLVVR
ncbi:hypothetical protein JCGZ_13835 [Jatropha curcas]|uniref:Uncharacterized protein n=1 Tax=Jatropha curcas TaxID=180498 RepID=A0A067KB75_JATCU|nr:hypothetical protein JCGZ_13835 [Jatropha curcas]